jgi:hypothetical protein
MSDVWYYVDSGRAVGPLSISELCQTLRSQPNWTVTLVWCEGFADWKGAGRVAELKKWMVTPPAVPGSQQSSNDIPTWQIRWWWYPIALLFLGSIGSWEGRKALALASSERVRKRNPARAKGASAIERVNSRFNRKIRWGAPRNVTILSAGTLYGLYVGLEKPPPAILSIFSGLIGGLVAGAIVIGIADALGRLGSAVSKKFPRTAFYVGVVAFWLGIILCVGSVGVSGYLIFERAPIRLIGTLAASGVFYGLLGWGIRRALTS